MKSKAKLAALLSVVLLFSNFHTLKANAEWNGFSMLRDCKNTPNQPCIESIVATTANGKKIVGVLTGRTAIGDGTAPANIDDEYQFDGLQFEAPAGNKMVARLFYDGSMFQTVFEASWLDQTPETLMKFLVPSPHRTTNLNCGSSVNPTRCYRNINFNQDLTFLQRIRVPKSFVTAYVNGRTDYLTYKTGLNPVTIDGMEYSTIELNIHISKKAQVTFSDVLPNPLASSEWADTEIDQTIANFFSTKSGVNTSLGACAGIPSLTVISNGINPEVPFWDSASRSISVQVAGPHFKVNGELNSGFFEARISKEIGKCLWGVDLSTETKAEIRLTEQGTDGSTTIQTISGKYDGKDYVLNAGNFHYSSPKISVKLLDSQVVPAQETSKVSSTINIPKKITITCYKGKTIKKVSTVKPMCPSGYKLKK